jgi:hypothetical protein
VFDLVEEAGLDWAFYYADAPLEMALLGKLLDSPLRIKNWNTFKADIRRGTPTKAAAFRGSFDAWWDQWHRSPSGHPSMPFVTMPATVVQRNTRHNVQHGNRALDHRGTLRLRREQCIAACCLHGHSPLLQARSRRSRG